MNLCPGNTHTQSIFISELVLYVGWQVLLTGALFVCLYAQPRCASLSDGYCLFAVDQCSLLTRPEPDERRRCSLKLRYLPLDSSVDLLCHRSSSTMSHQLTEQIKRDRWRTEIFHPARLYSFGSLYRLILA